MRKSGAPCGPSSTASSQDLPISGRASAGSAPGARAGSTSSPRRSTSPGRSGLPAWPPKPPSVNVARLPRCAGTSMPPRMSR
ncbi:hypothetical protein SCE1572_29570 [Sorangium cellulosum So0157-2]|uniref:Uncharacterized protein n=1 Tax=Sorangium cellulosum So0157-2 TaxID=1254432 RepID=S4Y243_SORCE|nr:hypothetical protein SCE1572_29570 [Sorangium cellulosum So0157-2]